MPRATRKIDTLEETANGLPPIEDVDVSAPPKRPKARRSRQQEMLLPLLPIRDQVYFPHMIFPLLVGRDRSVRALDEAIASNRKIVLVAQRLVDTEEPDQTELYTVGITAEVMQVLRVPDGTVRVMLEGLQRVQILHYIHDDPFFRVLVQPLATLEQKDLEVEALMRGVNNQFEQIVNTSRNIAPEALINAINTQEPGKLCDTITPYLYQLRVDAKQEILEALDVRVRLEKLTGLLKKEIEILEIQRNIRSRVEKEMGDTQREMILREQLKAIQHELGERDDRAVEIEEFKQKIEEAKMPETVAERALKEVDRLEKMPYAAPEGVVIRTYLDWMIALPWDVATDDTVDIDAAEKILDEDHFGLKKVKERILEFLAVRKLAGRDMKGPILCFAGPPGVGKTSIGRSIARSLGRKFVRISLGGVRDEAEIRGHRRTYVGSMPGRIIQGIKQAGTRNPVFMLDEIDKLGQDFRGDPGAALLEALDPEQNGEFSDHYLEAPFDLREVMFITTANLLDPIPHALRDRMEVIEFAGYTEAEKRSIGQQFLVPKQRKEHGLKPDQLCVTDEAMLKIIREHTREAGVRNLEREIASVCRKVARAVAAEEVPTVAVDQPEVETYLGQRRYRHGLMEEKDEIGAATGLVYTEFGGDIVQIEVSLVRGHESRLLLTGQLGDVMKESAQAAMTFVKSRATELGIDEVFDDKLDIHVHVPAGAVPKDGPSAGVTMAVALASALTKRAVHKDIAMTGEITLRGKILPVGGVKEKVLAAHRSGLTTVLLPEDNRKDLVEDVPENVQKEMKFVFIKSADEALKLALAE
jgi:ATP-dependent Lon protease